MALVMFRIGLFLAFAYGKGAFCDFCGPGGCEGDRDPTGGGPESWVTWSFFDVAGMRIISSWAARGGYRRRYYELAFRDCVLLCTCGSPGSTIWLVGHLCVEGT